MCRISAINEERPLAFQAQLGRITSSSSGSSAALQVDELKVDTVPFPERYDAIETETNRRWGVALTSKASHLEGFIRATGGSAKKTLTFTAKVIGAPIAAAAFVTAAAFGISTLAAGCLGLLVGASVGLLFGMFYSNDPMGSAGVGANYGAQAAGTIPFVLALIFLQAGSYPYGFNGYAFIQTGDMEHAIQMANQS